MPLYFSVTRVYWSTVDPRRRCVYTCRIIEVNPQQDQLDIVMKDLTVVHEESHPDYNHDLIKSLAEASQKINMRKSRQEKEEKSERERRMRHGVGDCKYTKCDQYFEDESPKPKRSSKIKQASHNEVAAAPVTKKKLGIPFLPDETGAPLRGMPYQPAVLLPDSALRQIPKVKPSAIQIWKEKNMTSIGLSNSWPGTAASSPTTTTPTEINQARPKSMPDLGGLSPSTLKLLGHTDLTKFAPTVQSKQPDSSDLALNQIADRLNMAAAKNKTVRQSSVEPNNKEGKRLANH